MNKATAQRRVDRIRAFREELEALRREQGFLLPEEAAARLGRHHDEILQRLAGEFDIDLTDAQKQMSWGMRISTMLGALALCAAAFFFFFRFWGLVSTPAQVAILLAAPLAALAATELAFRRDVYFATLAGLLACACFVLDLRVLGMIFNIRPTPNAFLPWGAFALALAYAYGMRLLQVAGILCLVGFLSATVGTWSGVYWLSLGERPENFFAAGALLFAASIGVPHRRRPEFPPVYRLCGLLSVFLPILVLSNWGEASYLRLESGSVEVLYQILGFALAGAAVWLGIRRDWREVTHTGSTFFVVFLYTKFFDWWWDWMPKYLFFLVLALAAVLILLVLRRVRGLAVRAA